MGRPAAGGANAHNGPIARRPSALAQQPHNETVDDERYGDERDDGVRGGAAISFPRLGQRDDEDAHD